MSMTTQRNASEMVERAVRRLPTNDRERFADEWRHDVSAATDSETAWQVARGARSMARRLWWRHAGLALLGMRGPTAFAIGWLIAIAMAVPVLFGGPLFLLMGVAALFLTVRALLDAGVSSLPIRIVEATSLIVGVAAFTYYWWAWGIAFDALDSFRPVPAAASYDTLALIVLLASIVCFLGALVTSLVRRKR